MLFFATFDGVACLSTIFPSSVGDPDSLKDLFEDVDLDLFDNLDDDDDFVGNLDECVPDPFAFVFSIRFANPDL